MVHLNVVNMKKIKIWHISDTLFSNGSVVTDNKFGTLSSNGNILEYESR